MNQVETAVDNAAALKELEELMTAQPNTPQGKRLDELVTLVEAYESKHYRKEFVVK